MLKIDSTNFKAGLTIGTALFLGYGFQTVGIQYTSASNAAFITGLSVVLVPLLNIPFTKRLPGRYAVAGAISAAFGLGLLSLNSGFTITKGDFLVFLCAIAFAFHIILVSRFAPEMDTTLLTIIQIGIVAIFSGLVTANLEGFTINFTHEVWLGLAICAIPATSLAYWIQNKVQKYTSPAKTAIIFSTEPVFGALFSYLWLGELLTMKGAMGGLLVLFGILLAELSAK
jgi:drug/metabolite transporter (DMT)-like permease